MNELTRAWNLLKPEERPVGLVQWDDGGSRGVTWGRQSRPSDIEIGEEAARDRLIVAVSNVNLRENSHETWDAENQTYHWQYAGDHPFASSRDRLTAANDALEAIRKDDDATG